MSAAAQLARRVADLDHGPGSPAGEGVHADLAHFIQVLQEAVPPGQPPDPARVETLTAAQADRLQRRCRLLRRLAARVPQLTDGPLDLAAQYWVATGNPPHLPGSDPTPRESRFIPVARADPLSGAKPFRAGLFTSTGIADSYGMWRCYLRGYEGSASLYLMPWHTWRLQPRPDTRVYEIRDAAHWVHLITTHPRAEGGFVQPDWASVAAAYDAVHITLRAITAAQGFSFATAHGPTVAPYWDAEFDLLAELVLQRRRTDRGDQRATPGTAHHWRSHRPESHGTPSRFPASRRPATPGAALPTLSARCPIRRIPDQDACCSAR